MRGDGNNRALIALSGGLESTATAYKRLAETDDEIWIMHLKIMRGHTDRHNMEIDALDKIIPWLKENTRDFNVLPYIEVVTPSVIPGDFPDIDSTKGTKFNYGIVLDHDVVAIYGAWWAKRLLVDKFLCGRSETEDSTIKGRLYNQSAHAIFVAACLGWPVVQEWPLRIFKKRDIVKMLPLELYDMIVSCRFPEKQDDDTWKTCGHCHACLRNWEATESKHPDVTTEELIARHANGTLFELMDYDDKI